MICIVFITASKNNAFDCSQILLRSLPLFSFFFLLLYIVNIQREHIRVVIRFRSNMRAKRTDDQTSE